MNPASSTAIHPGSPTGSSNDAPSSPPVTSRWQSLPLAPLLLSAALLALTLFPRVNSVSTLVWTLVGVAATLLVWAAVLWPIAKGRGQAFRVEFVPVKSHYVQALIQGAIMAYWGYYARAVYSQLPLLLAQIFYFYGFDALMSWSRGRSWRLGFGPLPIVLSTNLLLWFKDDWYYYQFAMLTVGALGKNFLTWERDGKRTHIFNPSAFGQIVAAIVLIATATTKELTWGREIATTFEVPHMVLVIFVGGLIVQSMFQVTLMTLAAVGALAAANLAYTGMTGGLYYFVNTNIAAPIFLGVHLLITDPATSPKSNAGRVIFGALYGLGYFFLFRVLEAYEVPLFWDKLLPVPILNLCVPLIEKFSRSGWLGRVNRIWESALTPHRLNWIHMSCWVALFATLLGTHYIDAAHPGDSIPFWKKAFAEGKPHAGQSLVLATGAQAEVQGSPAAINELGLIVMQAKVPGVKGSHAKAAEYFSRACELGNPQGCANVAAQFLFLKERRSDEDVSRALLRLEQECEAGTDRLACYLLANAYETGRGRPVDLNRAVLLYRKCGKENPYGCKGLARIALSGISHPRNPIADVAQTLQSALEAGDAESGWYLAYMLQNGVGVLPDEAKARTILEKSCKLGMPEACEALAQEKLPAYKKPVMSVPDWSTAFPVQ